MVGAPVRSGIDGRAARRIGLGVLTLGLACVAPVTAAGPAGSAAALSAAPTAVAGIGWKPCGEDLECGRVRVPLNWRRPAGRRIGLSVIRHPASDPEHRIGTMFFNPGGPGQSGVDVVRGDPQGLDEYGDGRFDVVSWDPRGTGDSAPVRCFRGERARDRFWRGAAIPIHRPASIRFRRRTAALARRCGEISGGLLRHLSTADTARDLDYLRKLVGDPQLTYLGFSYGSFLGQTYANLFPNRVRAMLLDGIVDQRSWVKDAEAHVRRSIAPADDVFAAFLSLCERAGPERCALAGGRLPPADRATRLFARLRRAPIPAPEAKPPGRLTYGDLLLSLFEPIRSPQRWPGLAHDLDAALGGDGSALETEARMLRTPAAWSGVATSDAIQCSDGPARRRSRAWPGVIARLTNASHLQGPVQGWWTWAACASWPADASGRYAGPWGRPTPNPILLIGTRHDPNTGYANAVRAERRLGNAVLLTHDGYGHVSFQDPSECVRTRSVDYLVDLVVPADGTVCPSDRRPFDPDFGEPLP